MNMFFSDFLARFALASTVGNAGNSTEVVRLLRRCRGPEGDCGITGRDFQEDEGPSARRFPQDSASFICARSPAKFAMHR